MCNCRAPQVISPPPLPLSIPWPGSHRLSYHGGFWHLQGSVDHLKEDEDYTEEHRETQA